jgi:hypothetical protein
MAALQVTGLACHHLILVEPLLAIGWGGRGTMAPVASFTWNEECRHRVALLKQLDSTIIL